MNSFLRRMCMVTLVTAMALLGASVNPVSAIGYAWGFFPYASVVPGETVYLNQSGDVCPSGGYQDVKANIVDSTNQVLTTDVTPTQSGGHWGSGYLHVPYATSLGAASVVLECWSGSIVTRTFDPVSLLIVAQSTSIAIDRDANVWSTITINSVVPCTTESYVDVRIMSASTTYDGYYMRYDHDQSLSAMSDTSGNWSTQVFVNPNTSGMEAFVAGQTYSIRATCWSTVDPYQAPDKYAGHLFKVLRDRYVALGDSYSSGQGSFNYDLTGGDCRRSTDSYPYYLVDNLSFDFPDFAACGGAVTDDLFNSNPVNTAEIAQLDHLSQDTQDVTLTIGGNDVGFEPVLAACVDYFNHSGFGCSYNSTMTSEVADRIGKLSGYGSVTAPGGRTIHSYADVLTEITTKAPNAKVYISGYPRLFGENPTDWTSDLNAPGTFKCAVYAGTVTFVYVSYNDGMWMNDRVDDLNAAIKIAVDNLNSPNVVYVPSSTFDGHGLCDSGVPYLNGVMRNDSDGGAQPESFHPNVEGMSYGYGVAFANQMD